MTHPSIERAYELLADADVTLADMEERRARREAGEVAREWQLPEREPQREPPVERIVQDAVARAVAAERQRLQVQFRARLDGLAEMLGEEAGMMEKRIVSTMRDEMKAQALAHSVEMEGMNRRLRETESRSLLPSVPWPAKPGLNGRTLS